MSTESTPRPTNPGPRPAGSYAPRPPYTPGAGRPGQGPGQRPGQRPGGGYVPGGKGRLPVRHRGCRVCEEKKGFIDWKAINYIRGFVTDRGKILAGRSKWVCSPCQRALGRAIKRARNMALLSYTGF